MLLLHFIEIVNSTREPANARNRSKDFKKKKKEKITWLFSWRVKIQHLLPFGFQEALFMKDIEVKNIQRNQKLFYYFVFSTVVLAKNWIRLHTLKKNWVIATSFSVLYIQNLYNRRNNKYPYFLESKIFNPHPLLPWFKNPEVCVNHFATSCADPCGPFHGMHML